MEFHYTDEKIERFTERDVYDELLSFIGEHDFENIGEPMMFPIADYLVFMQAFDEEGKRGGLIIAEDIDSGQIVQASAGVDFVDEDTGEVLERDRLTLHD